MLKHNCQAILESRVDLEVRTSISDGLKIGLRDGVYKSMTRIKEEMLKEESEEHADNNEKSTFLTARFAH